MHLENSSVLLGSVYGIGMSRWWGLLVDGYGFEVVSVKLMERNALATFLKRILSPWNLIAFVVLPIPYWFTHIALRLSIESYWLARICLSTALPPVAVLAAAWGGWKLFPNGLRRAANMGVPCLLGIYFFGMPYIYLLHLNLGRGLGAGLEQLVYEEVDLWVHDMIWFPAMTFWLSMSDGTVLAPIISASCVFILCMTKNEGEIEGK